MNIWCFPLFYNPNVNCIMTMLMIDTVVTCCMQININNCMVTAKLQCKFIVEFITRLGFFVYIRKLWTMLELGNRSQF